MVRNLRAIYKVQKPSLGIAERRESRNRLNDRMKHTLHRKQLHLTRVFGGIIFTNSISWLPVVVLAVVGIATTSAPPLYVIISTILFSSQVILHPILESTLISDIRKPMKKMVTCYCLFKKCGSSEHDTSNSWCCRHGEDNKGQDSFCGCGFVDYCNALWLPHLLSTQSIGHAPGSTPSNGNMEHAPGHAPPHGNTRLTSPRSSTGPTNDGSCDQPSGSCDDTRGLPGLDRNRSKSLSCKETSV